MEFQRKEKIQITTVVFTGSNGVNINYIETSNAGLASSYDSDWYLNLFLTKDIELTEYIEINKDTYQLTIDRQDINPYFYELGFFETIESINYDSENISFWANIVNINSVQTSESPQLYNALFNVMGTSLILKSNVFNIELQPTPTASTTSDITTIVNKMNDIKNTTENNQISFFDSNLPS